MKYTIKWWRAYDLADPPVGHYWSHQKSVSGAPEKHRHGDCDKHCFALEATAKKEVEGGQSETRD